jgi:hypothetical protein
MRSATTTILILGLLASPTGGAHANDDAKTSDELALELLEITGGTAMAQQVMDMMSAQMRPAYPSVPQAFWDELIGSLDGNQLSAMMVPVYSKYYSREDLLALLQFYRTPLGQRVIKLSPAIMQESMEIGGAWGRAKAAEIIERLQKQGYQPEQI